MKLAGLFSIILLSSIQKANAWGFFGHQLINRMACFSLPVGMFPFFKSNIDYLTTHAVDADKRRYSDPDEAPRHFIDLDRYGENPFDSLPERWLDAIKKYPEDSLKAHGIVAWHIQIMYYRLQKAFEEKDVGKILYYSANIGHYIADAHVPLHCTANYNGQLTNQTGIHGFWESRLPELFSGDYDFYIGQANYIENITKFSWNILRQSFAAVDSVLGFERALNKEFSTDKKYAFEMRGNQLIRTYSSGYSENYHELLSGQVERRMQEAILAIGSVWYTAWANAGMPVLDSNVQKDFEEEKAGVDSVKAAANRICD